MIWVSLVIGAWVILTPLFKNKTPVNARVVESVFDVSEMEAGEVDIVEWFGKPLVIARRTQVVEDLLLLADRKILKDPDSEKSLQPDFAGNPLRSATPGWFVAIGLGTGSGCALKYSDPSDELINGRKWPGGFVDPCDGSRYDLAGRVLVKHSAKRNIPVPVWRMEPDKLVVSTGQKY